MEFKTAILYMKKMYKILEKQYLNGKNSQSNALFCLIGK